ncbi:MAG TPA: GNAT family N-acetyltransferase [Candidatus Limnocylindrales bacterium]|nr:GNAT family N-acetyltransferase [Candidatus Limnocylindrales bacterium]
MNAGGFTIRPATADDASAEADLEYDSAIHHATIDPDRWRVPAREDVAGHRRYWSNAKPRDAGFVAVTDAEGGDGGVVGMIELWLRRPIAVTGNARVARLEVNLGIAVAPDWRGRGVGTALLRAGEAWAREQGAERMSLWVDGFNTGARRLYERMGYTAWGLEMDKPIDPEPEAVDGPQLVRNADGEVVPTLVGDRVTLRPMRRTDRAAIIRLLEDPSIAAIWDTRGPAHSADELLAGDANFTVWAIEVDGEFAGSIQASEEPDPDYRKAGIDIFVSTRFQDRGLGTDALRTLVRYLIDIRGHHRLTIDPAASNARAIRSYEKVGFRPVGVMRRYERGKDGSFHDGLLMDLLADDLRSDDVRSVDVRPR